MINSMPETGAYSQSKDQLFQTLQTSGQGLTSTEAANRLKQHGPNLLTAKKKVSPLQIFFEQFKNTLTLILIGSAILILFIYFFGEKEQSDLIEAGLIIAIVLMIALLGFFQEFKAEKAVESLKKLLAFKAKVRRDGKEQEVDVSHLVIGDIVILEEGNKIPADIRLIEVFGLYTNEASLTGESTTVSKKADVITSQVQIADQKNMVFSGTAVTSGRAIGVVVATGDRTEIGKIANLVAGTRDEKTPIQERLDQIGKIISFLVLGIAGVVFIFIIFFANDFSSPTLLQKILHSFIASVALAVAAIPEGLPAVVTIALALGTQRMFKKNTLVRKLNSIETLGSTDVICSDKTGTLTKGEMTVTQIYSDGKTYQLSGTGYETAGKFVLDGKETSPDPLKLLLQAGLECNNAGLQYGKVLGDPTEAALLVSAYKAGLNTKLERVHEIPFSSARKMMTVAVKDGNDYLVFSKGAPEVILSRCNKADEHVLEQTRQMSTQALRTLGFAYKKLSAKEFETIFKTPEKLEQGLTFLGLQGMIDPPRGEVKSLIEQCHKSGIKVIMITGDHLDTAKAVASEIGIGGEAITSDELDQISPGEFKKRVEQITIYARVNPGSKTKIVQALKDNGHIVAMTGDGVNDAPALKNADIGIAMGITGTDVSKEASDMILMDDHFGTIVAAVEEGRGIFHNIKKFVSYLLSSNIAEVMVVFAAIILFKELPLSASMLLWINVVTDGLPAVALGMDPAEKNIMRYSPKAFQTQIINRSLWIKMVFSGTLITIGTLGIFFLNLPEGYDQAKGAAFTAIVVFELVNLYLIRSHYKTSFLSNKWLFIAVAVSFLFQVAIIYLPFLANLFNVKHIDLLDWGYILVASTLIWVIFRLTEGLIDYKFAPVVAPDN